MKDGFINTEDRFLGTEGKSLGTEDRFLSTKGKSLGTEEKSLNTVSERVQPKTGNQPEAILFRQQVVFFNLYENNLQILW